MRVKTRTEYPNGRQQGFTLIEVMLVVLLIGLSSTVILMTVDDSSQKKAMKRAAFKMAALSGIALDKAVLSGRDFGIVFASNTYHFVELVEERWQPVNDEVLQKQTLANVQLTVQIEGFQWLPDQQDFSSNLLFSDREFDEEKDEKEKPHIPQLLILSSGEITPFELTLILDGEKNNELRQDERDYIVTVSGNMLGLLSVVDSNDEQFNE